jgi:hypothetical protein
MDGRQFDSIAKALGAGSSRRRVLVGLLGGVLAGRFARDGAQAQDGLQGACAEFCRQLEGKARGECIAAAAKGAGLCYQCGPAAPANASQALCARTGQCVSTFCNVRRVFNPGTCACECDATQYVALPGGGCGIPCDDDTPCNCDTTTEGQRVCNCGYSAFVGCTSQSCDETRDCNVCASAINVYCTVKNDFGVCGVVC